MRIAIIGGGPAGLYFALLMKKLDPAHQITLFERDGPNDTFGWGIVFSDQTFAYLAASDNESLAQIQASCQVWDNVDIVHRGQKVSVRGNHFSGIGRLAFLNILQRRAAELEVDIRFHAGTTPDEVGEYDLLVGADGANSLTRKTFAGFFQPTVELRKNKYIWLGTHRLFNGLTLTFRETEDGLFIAHSYKFNETTSTFIVECDEETWNSSR
ncbi:MAG TPA: bifunctional salicylyl-CoA 5-hydroxylase/oxidoreductase, partial [Blastocatellia bacterium]